MMDDLLKALSEQRKSKRRSSQLCTDRNPLLADWTQGGRILPKAYEILGDINRYNAWLLVDVIGFSYKQARSILSMPMGSLKTRIADARAELKKRGWYNPRTQGNDKT